MRLCHERVSISRDNGDLVSYQIGNIEDLLESLDAVDIVIMSCRNTVLFDERRLGLSV